jgi:hypothetical protein
MRQKAHFVSRIKAITSVQPFSEKYLTFYFSEIEVSSERLASREGRTRRHGRRVRDAMAAANCAGRAQVHADGEVVGS